ncbi:SpoIIE family protein phosphatase [Planctomicrobium sp. SH664]|uniref:SpoIIE family protein phosphatase n=1 Tax=Planctomicrobium sp. SH664 TaxID=3448125 RepID=UPI003F5BB190
MAVLQIVKGGPEGTQFPLVEDRTILGRHPNCQVVLESGVVSRHHAQILQSHGTCYIEDLRSRNGTYVNDSQIAGRTELRDGDEIRLCDVVLTFLMYPSTAIPIPVFEQNHLQPLATEGGPPLSEGGVTFEESHLLQLGEEEVAADFESSTSIRKLPGEATHKSTVDPAVKLKAILEITHALGRELAVESVLPKMLETLFNIFPQSDQGFVLLKEADTGKLKVKASRTSRGSKEAESVAVSMTVIRHAMQTRESILSHNISNDSRFKKSNTLSRMRMRSMMCVPMVGQDEECLGVIQIVTRDEGRVFSEEDLDLLSSLAAQASMAVENARLHEEHVQRREIERDLEFATQVQLGFLPKSRPNLPDYSFADYYEAAQSVGGDYFDYIALPDGRLVMAIGDVAGKGMPAALLMARLYSSTRYQLLTKASIEEAVSGLNEEISSSGLGHRFITFLLMVIDPATHEARMVNAGHSCPLLRAADGTVTALGKEKSSLPLGIVPDLTYESSTFRIGPGEALIAYTDGVTEAMSADRAIYGNDRLIELISRTSGSIGEIIDAIVADVEEFSSDVASRDDTCLIGVRRSET